MPRSLELLFEDIAERVTRLRFAVQEQHREEFLQSRISQDSAERNLQVIGEALAQALQQEPSLTWKVTETQKIIALRHLLTHHYYKVSPETIWGILIKNLPQLALEVANQRSQRATKNNTDE